MSSLAMVPGVLILAVISSPAPAPTPGTGAHCRRSVLEQHLTPALLQPIWAAPLLVSPSQPEPPCMEDLPLFNYQAALPLLTNE